MPYLRCQACSASVEVPNHKVKTATCPECVQKKKKQLEEEKRKPGKKIGFTAPTSPASPGPVVYGMKGFSASNYYEPPPAIKLDQQKMKAVGWQVVEENAAAGTVTYELGRVKTVVAANGFWMCTIFKK